jgi:type II secretory ATPase GspE/PulE/Tfp pilus assembly ATPase PilB-like protein
VKIRLRIDGILQEIGEIKLSEYPNLLGEIKILSGLKAETRQGVIDSRFTVKLADEIEQTKDNSVDIRLSLILGGFGETVVMRLLNQGAVALDVDNLGLRKENLVKIIDQIKRPNGVVLNTGPTGSGKTTTLYSLLKVLNKPEVKIITVEDPIEYQLEGILQTPISEKEGYTFSTALRALLRQNPDILMIGEIRDNETAVVAAQAALTGHLVLSTLHTNSAVGSIQRLLNMGVSANDIAASSNAFIAQRLVRRLCECKEKVAPTEEERALIEPVLKSVPAASGIKVSKLESIYRPKGCPKCNHLGYQGRTTISEVLVVDREMKDLINQGATENQIQDKAQELGMITMIQDAILKVVEGETSLSEAQRVTEV